MHEAYYSHSKPFAHITRKLRLSVDQLSNMRHVLVAQCALTHANWFLAGYKSMLELDHIFHRSVEVERVVDEVAVPSGKRMCVTLYELRAHQEVIGCHRRPTLQVTTVLYEQRRIGTCSVRAQCSVKDRLESTKLFTLHCVRMCRRRIASDTGNSSGRDGSRNMR